MTEKTQMSFVKSLKALLKTYVLKIKYIKVLNYFKAMTVVFEWNR